jgi:hypothetical protein
LQGYDNNNLIETRKLSAYWGALRKEDFIKASSDINSDLYIGELKKNLLNKYSLNGFAILIKQDNIYIGNFLQSKPDGLLSLYKHGKLFYKGDWKDGHFDGKGTLYKENGEIKSGVWKNDTLISTTTTVSTSKGEYTGSIYKNQAEGQGIMKYNDGNYYRGAWSKDKWEGEGLLVTARNDSVVGKWKDSKLTGYGILKSSTLIYEGEWENNKPNGTGYMYSELDSVFYSGGWADGKKTGYGDLIINDSVSYSGGWLDNKFNGDGIFHYANRDFYKGEWKESLQHGVGIYNSKDYKYEGEWEEGWMNGSGKILFSNGDYYEGNFVENERYGIGKYHFIDGNTYEGEFVDNTFNGLGTFQFADGNWYEGEFANGKIQGEGTLYYIEGKDTLAITAEWDGTSQFPKQASVLFSNGDLYEGELINGFPTDNGNWTTEQDRIDAENNRNIILKANDFFKRHKDTWNKIITITSIVLIVVVMVAAPPVAAAAGSALLTLNVVDATTSIASAGIDVYDAVQKGENPTEAWTTLGIEVVSAAAFFAPQALKNPVRKAAVALSPAAKKLGQQALKRLITLDKNKTFGKIITIVKNSADKKSTEDLIEGGLNKVLETITSKKFIQRLLVQGKNQVVTNQQFQKLSKEITDKIARVESLDGITRNSYKGQLQLLKEHKNNSILNIFKYVTM